MTEKKAQANQADELRKRAEEIFRGKAARKPENLEALSPEAGQQVLHELWVHQIELEMQNQELRRAQAELEASRESYFDLYDLAPVGYCTLNEKGLILQANITAAALLGVVRGTLVKQPITRFILPADQDIYYRHRKQLFKTGARQVCELRMLRTGCAPFWARLESTVAQAADGAPVCRAVMSDITERKRAEEVLRETEERYRSLYHNMLNGYAFCKILFDDENKPVDFIYIDVNDAFEKQTGLRKEDVIDKRVTEAMPSIKDLNPEIIPIYGEVASTGKPVSFEAFFKPLDRWLHISVYSARKDYFVALFDNITERKRAEEAAQASLREKEILLREIHHRVKNNMQVISSLFNLQAGHIKDEDARRILKEGQLRIRSMALIHEKLYQSRDLSKIDFASYLQSLLVHLFQFFMVDANQIRLETDLEEVYLDINSAMPCGLLVNELISNALRHAFPEGRKGVVGIRLRRERDGTLELRIEDNGVGFPEGLDFRRTDSLGLQIVGLLVGQLEGKIKLDREKGTAFTVTFRALKYKPRI